MKIKVQDFLIFSNLFLCELSIGCSNFPDCVRVGLASQWAEETEEFSASLDAMKHVPERVEVSWNSRNSELVKLQYDPACSAPARPSCKLPAKLTGQVASCQVNWSNCKLLAKFIQLLEVLEV